MIVALERKLLINLWRMTTTGETRVAGFSDPPTEPRQDWFWHGLDDRTPMTIRGGGIPQLSMASVPGTRMGPPFRSSPLMRMTASW